MIVFDASSLVGAVLKSDSLPERALHHAVAAGRLALSSMVWDEIVSVLSRPKLVVRMSDGRRDAVLTLIAEAADWFVPVVDVEDCRDPKDNMYLELALASVADCIVSSVADLQVMSPWRGIPVFSPAAYLLAT